MGRAGKTWTAWLEELAPALLLFARQWTATHADAEEAVQEAFLRFWRTGRRRAADPRAYLFACVKRAALDLQRGEGRRRGRERAAGQRSSTGHAMFETDLERDEWREAVEKALSELPIEQREVLVMKVWGELTFPQIGEALGISPNTAASRHRYALEALRQKLSGGDWR